MIESKLVKHLKDLQTKDQERFRLFVRSPYFNQHEKTASLLDLILDSFSQKNPAKLLEKEKVFRKLFPGTAYEEQQVYNLMSALKKLLMRFLAQEYFEHRTYLGDVFTLESAYKRNQFDLLTNRAKQLQKQLEKAPARDEHYQFAQYRLNYLLGYYSGQYVDRSKSATMQLMMHHLDLYFITEKLRHACHLTAHEIMINTSYDFGLLDSLSLFLESRPEILTENAAIRLYATILKTLRDDSNPQHYEDLKAILIGEMDSFSEQERQDLYGFSYNYCIRKINQGDSRYQPELFQLYQQGLQTGILLHNGFIGEWDYKNIATLGCSLKEFEWTENFLQNYRDKLPEHQRENAYYYNLGNLYYNKKMYDQAITTLLHVQFTDVAYHLNTTFLLLRTYHAQRDTEALLSLIDTFRVYILRNQKMATDQKKGYTNFLRFAKRIVLLKHQSALSKQNVREKLTLIANQVENTEHIINRYWLLEECRA